MSLSSLTYLDICINSCVCLDRLLLHEPSREELMYSTRLIADALDCLSHPHPAVRKLAAQMATLCK